MLGIDGATFNEEPYARRLIDLRLHAIVSLIESSKEEMSLLSQMSNSLLAARERLVSDAERNTWTHSAPRLGDGPLDKHPYDEEELATLVSLLGRGRDA